MLEYEFWSHAVPSGAHSVNIPGFFPHAVSGKGKGVPIKGTGSMGGG